eukprot:12186820-Ditylum_brightwellii.AAC.1
MVKEVGTCGAGLEMNITTGEKHDDDYKLKEIIGSSPYIVIQYPNGWGLRNRKSRQQNDTKEDNAAVDNKNKIKIIH